MAASPEPPPRGFRATLRLLWRCDTAWALAQGIQANPWREIMPLLGWGAGGFASQVWYTYWVLGVGFGSAAGRGYGKPADALGLAAAAAVFGWLTVTEAVPQVLAAFGGLH